ELHEGGIRTPLIARWPGSIQGGQVCSNVVAAWDVLPTLAEISGVEPPGGIDGISFAPVLFGKPLPATHDLLYWEVPGDKGVRVLRSGEWKLMVAEPGSI